LALILEIKVGPLARKQIPVAAGQSLVIGRAPDRAQFAIPHDTHMSGVHFAVECGPNGCRVIDKKSTNGTHLNGAKIQEAMLASGDEIKSGQTVFVVRIVPDDQLPTASSSPSAVTQSPDAIPREIQAPIPAPVRPSVAHAPAPTPTPDRTYKAPETPAPSPAVQDRPAQHPVAPTPRPSASGPAFSPRPGQPPALAIGSWAFHKVPSGWQIQEGLGIQQDVKDAFPASVGAMEEPLGPGITLPQYVEAQTKMFREYLREPKIDAALPPTIPGSAETVALEVRYSTRDGQSVYYHRVYARSGSTIGVLTLTALEKDVPSLRPVYDSFLSAISFSRKD
jgi:pSer/pThr/pTyr-binding forkhead associated (FHA) protein